MYSSLTDYVRISPNSTVPRNHAIDTVTIHHMAGSLTVEQCGELFAQASRQASSNYAIGSDGRIACFVEEENRSWCSGSRENDHRAITIEVANSGGAPDWPVSDEAYASLIALCADICRRYGFTLRFTGDKTGNLTMHKWFQATACPGPWLEARFPQIAREVNSRLEEGALPLLSGGSRGAPVRALQILLAGYGFDIGRWGADGILGDATKKALEQFQEDRSLTPDGICGALTWAALLGVAP